MTENGCEAQSMCSGLSGIMLDLRLIVAAEDLMIDDEPSNEIHSKFPSAVGTTLGTNISDRLYRLIHRESANSRNIVGCGFGYFPCRKSHVLANRADSVVYSHTDENDRELMAVGSCNRERRNFIS